MIYVSYYGLVFGRPVVGEKRLAALVHALEKPQRLEDIPESKDVWELQYRNKTWDYLANNEEVSRYSVIIGYIQHFKPKASIFDIGCGEGILQERLSTFGYTSYIGLDISETAVQRACLKSDTKTDFISGNAESYVPQELFDVIVFNEVLYYFRDPLETFVRYSKFLKENGIIITSLEHTIRSTAIRRRIKKIYPALVETKITNTHKNFTWFCTAFALSQKTG
jgi:2-polyprenyl-3-methyl-5-hydroxy-6-metoxy-1,4-benzoquinol methylase